MGILAKPSALVFRTRLIIGSLLLMMLAAGLQTAFGQEADNLDEQVQAQTRKLSHLTSEFANGAENYEDVRQNLIQQRNQLQAVESDLEAELGETQSTLSRLGDPVRGEASDVTALRQTLEGKLQELDEALEQTRQNMDQVDRLEAEIADIRRSAFYEELTERRSLLFQPSVWGRATAAFVDNLNNLEQDLSEREVGRFGPDAGPLPVVILVLSLIVAVLIAIPARKWVNQRFVRPLTSAGYDSSLSVPIGLISTLLSSLPWLLSILLVSNALYYVGYLTPSLKLPVQSLASALAIVALIMACLRVFFSTSAPVAPFHFAESFKSRWLWTACLFATLTIGIDHAMRVEISVYGGAAALDTVQRGVATLILSACLLVIAHFWPRRAPGQPEDEEIPTVLRKEPLALSPWLRTLLVIIAFLSALGAVFGYAPFAHFILTRVFLLGGLLLSVLIIKSALDQIMRAIVERVFQSGEKTTEKSDLLEFWFGALISICLFLVAIPLALLLIGLDWESVVRLIDRSMTGIQIGNVSISPIQISIALLVFLALIAVTRLVQRVAERRVLQRLKVDTGVQNSLKTLIGYIGLLFAFFTGVSLLGFDLSNLAIIAGALSVGIGFGLQSIVNNFVSGLILLFERPIKVGDWIVTNSGEGIVKKISVRSTEIERFDRSSILVPNSELISSSVTNWTHKNRLGRVSVPIGVAYKEDPERILEILAKAVENIDGALSFPEPQVLFTGFGDSSLDFEMRFFISDVFDAIKARTAARVAIFKAFREGGVEIPFPQRDVHVQFAAGDLEAAISKKSNPE